MVTEIPAGEWRKLVLTALSWAEATPWEWVQDTQVFGVMDPATGQKVYCSVMGDSGELLGLAMYPGKKGWKSYLQLGSEDEDTHPTELVYYQCCLVVSFHPAQEAEIDDLSLLKHVGLADAVHGHVPSFRTYQPGYLPHTPGMAEVRLMQTVLPQALALLVELPGADHILPEEGLNEKGELLFRVYDPETDSWHSEWQLPDSNLDFSPPVVSLDHAQTAQAQALPAEEAIWLLEDFHLPEPAQDGQGRSFFPHAVVLFDVEAQEFRGISLLQPDDFPALVGEVLVEMMAQQEMRPSQLVVSKKSNLILVRPFCQALGMALHLQEDLDILEDLREALLESMEQGLN
jgi:hypothetical protein